MGQINFSAVHFLENRLNSSEVLEIIHLAKKVNQLENKAKSKIDSVNDKIIDVIVDFFTGEKIDNPDKKIEDLISNLIVSHYFDVTEAAIKSAKESKTVKLSKFPKSFKDLMNEWDKWRKRKLIPDKQKVYVNKIKDLYITKAKDFWAKHNDSWVKNEITKEEIKRKLVEKVKAAPARANTIVETETTRYWNDTRKNIYKEADSVTHYLYIPVRDMATTPWCFNGVKSPITKQEKKINPSGLRGRGGLVYTKEDEELNSICPSHWNCRSELVPLTPFNPRHKKMIEDKSIARKNHKCVPLPKGWGSK